MMSLARLPKTMRQNKVAKEIINMCGQCDVIFVEKKSLYTSMLNIKELCMTVISVITVFLDRIF